MSGWILAAWLSACAADATTTHVAMRRGAVEMLLTQSPVANDAIVGAQAAGFALTMRRLGRTHPRVAMGLGLALTALRSAAAAHNGMVIAGGMR